MSKLRCAISRNFSSLLLSAFSAAFRLIRCARTFVVGWTKLMSSQVNLRRDLVRAPSTPYGASSPWIMTLMPLRIPSFRRRAGPRNRVSASKSSTITGS